MNDSPHYRHRFMVAVSLLSSLKRPLPKEIWPVVFDHCRSLDAEADHENLIPYLGDCIRNEGMGAPRGWPGEHHLNRSIRQFQQWVDRGIDIILPEQIPSRSDRPPGFPPFFFGIGCLELINHPQITIINSRKPKTLSPGDRWVGATKGLFSSLDREDAAWVSSLGNYPYEMIGTLCADRDRPLILVLNDLLPEMLDKPKEAAFYQKYGKMFPPGKTLLLSAMAPGRSISSKDRQLSRDGGVVGLADRLGVAEVRPGGNMERLALFAVTNGKPVTVFKPAVFDRETGGNRSVLNAGASPWHLPAHHLVQPKKPAGQSPATLKINPDAHLDGQFLIHFTRSCPGIWPGQDWFDYYQGIINDAPEAGHTAFDTLIRILDEQKLRAQSGLIRGGSGVISFTAAGIMSARYLMQWRNGLIRWTFEPYGLAIHRRDLMARGVRPVIYGDERVWRRLPRRERFRFQKYSTSPHTWLKEKEWRMPGDLDLKGIHRDRIRVIVCSPDEAMMVKDRFGLPVLCLQRADSRSSTDRA